MVEHVATVGQLIIEEHVVAIPDNRRHCCIGCPAKFVNGKKKVARAGRGLIVGAKQQRANSCSLCLRLQSVMLQISCIS